MNELEVTQTVQVSAVPERVWRALTDPAELIQWYAPGCRWDIPKLAVNAPVRFFDSETDIQPATITALVPERRLALLWKPDANLPTSTLLTTYDLQRAEQGTNGDAPPLRIRIGAGRTARGLARCGSGCSPRDTGRARAARVWCFTPRALSTTRAWLENAAGPLLLLPDCLLAEWSGIDVPDFRVVTARFRWNDKEERACDYDRALDRDAPPVELFVVGGQTVIHIDEGPRDIAVDRICIVGRKLLRGLTRCRVFL